jgi:type II secretory pathway pseudopilin PulG
MVVVAVLGLLAAIAIPSLVKAREGGLNARFMVDLRTATGAFTTYAMDTGRYPADRTPAQMPAGMESYLVKMDWTNVTSLGGLWDWDYQQFGCTAGVSVYQPTAESEQLQKIDQTIDDGELTTGSFRARANGYISVIE